jgi:hypothetical protein
MAADPDVNDSGSSPDSPDPSAPGPDPVTNDDAQEVPGDRPIVNLKGEMDRKFGQQGRQINDLVAAVNRLAEFMAPRPEPQPIPGQRHQSLPDGEVLKLAQMGDAEALAELSRRSATQAVQSAQRTQHAASAVEAQYRALFARYPCLGDPAHPLTQAAMQNDAVLGQAGVPQTPARGVQAILAAIADNPQMAAGAIAGTPVGAADQSRRQPTTYIRQEGAAPRRGPTTVGGRPYVPTPKEREIAKRMGINDPAEAMKRFEARQQAGVSRVSPLVAAMFREEGR